MPIVAALAPLAIGAYQSISGGIKAAKARRAAENLQVPSYAPNRAINDYYQTALNRFQTGPYNTLQFQQGKKAADVALGTGINALQTRRAGVQNIGALTGQYQNSLERVAGQAEQAQRQNLSQLGQAANMQLGESRFAFGQNQLAPYQKQLQLDYARLGGANSLISAGLSNIGSGIQTAGLAAMRSGKTGGSQSNNSPYDYSSQSAGYGMNQGFY